MGSHALRPHLVGPSLTSPRSVAWRGMTGLSESISCARRTFVGWDRVPSGEPNRLYFLLYRLSGSAWRRRGGVE